MLAALLFPRHTLASMDVLLSLLTILPLFISLHLLRKLLSPKLPPGPTPYPIVGNLYQVKPLRFRCFAEWSQKYGPIMSVWFGTTLNVIVSSPELAKEVLRESDHVLSDRPRNRATARFSRDGMDLIWADYGPHYVKLRKLCNLELFSTKRLEALRPVREEEVTAMVESIFRNCTTPEGRINGNSSLVLRNHLSCVAFNNITRLAFGKRFMNSDEVMDKQGLEFKAVGVEGMKFSASISLGEYVSWLEWMFPLDEAAFAKHSARRDQLTRDIMNEHTIARNKNGAGQHFVDALLTLQEKYDLSEYTIMGLLWDMITAGMDTTVVSVEWAMAEIVKNPRIQQKVQEELDRAIGVDCIMSETDLAKLPYLHCVVKEALRLHPPTPLMLPHKASAKTKIGGYDVPKGSVIQVNAWAIARDPLLWKDPLEFRPERFEEENIDIKGNDFRVLPFGAGRRVCPGAQLGIVLVASTLGHLLHHFEWKLPEGMKADEVDMSEAPGLVTFKSAPLQAVAVPRLQPHLYKRVTTAL